MNYTPYDSHNHASPLLEGKKNSSFINPNLRSSNVFYDYDYSYKNDMHNPRLLSTVKNDKFAPSSRDERVQTRTWEDKTYSEQGDRRPSTAQKAWDTESNNGDRDYYQAPANRSQRGSVPNIRTGTSTRAKDLESLSTINEESNFNNARTAKTTRGGPGKYCADCVNSSLADRQKCKKESSKANDHKHMKEWVAEENRKATMNHDRIKQENIIARKNQVEANAHSNFHEYQRVYGKNEPEIEGGAVIETIYDKQEQRARQNKMNERTLRSYNQEKMVDNEVNKDVQRLDRLTSEHNSLQVGGTFQNKYISSQGHHVQQLVNQMDAKAVRDARNKNAEQRLDQEHLEANRIALEKEKQAKQEKVENYKRMLADQLEARNQVKDAEREKNRVEKEKARYYAQKTAEDHSATLQNKEVDKHRNKNMFMNSLKEQQQESSYRRLYQDKKSKLVGDGVTLKLANKVDMDNCAGCNKATDANQLTHFDHKH